MVETHDAIAQLPFSDSRSHRNNGSADLMSKNLRRNHKPVLDLLDVRAANAACGNLDQDFAGRDLRHRNVFNDNLPFAPIHCGAHRIEYLSWILASTRR